MEYFDSNTEQVLAIDENRLDLCNYLFIFYRYHFPVFFSIMLTSTAAYKAIIWIVLQTTMSYNVHSATSSDIVVGINMFSPHYTVSEFNDAVNHLGIRGFAPMDIYVQWVPEGIRNFPVSGRKRYFPETQTDIRDNICYRWSHRQRLFDYWRYTATRGWYRLQEWRCENCFMRL